MNEVTTYCALVILFAMVAVNESMSRDKEEAREKERACMNETGFNPNVKSPSAEDLKASKCFMTCVLKKEEMPNRSLKNSAETIKEDWSLDIEKISDAIFLSEGLDKGKKEDLAKGIEECGKEAKEKYEEACERGFAVFTCIDEKRQSLQKSP